MLGRLELLGSPPVRVRAPPGYPRGQGWGGPEALRGDITCPENRMDIRICTCVSPKLSHHCTLGGQMDKPQFYSL